MDKKYTEQYQLLKYNITFARRRRGLSQIQLAERVGISRTHMSNIEAPNGTTGFSLDVLFSIAAELEIPVTQLFGFNPGSV